MRFDEIAELTPYPDVNGLLVDESQGMTQILGRKLVGLYLTGSLTYGDFDPGSSDIDYLAILDRNLEHAERSALRSLHSRIARDFPEWAERIEGSYITTDMLASIEPPETARPYVNGGQFWEPDPHYGNEWLINLFALRERGIALVGPDPTELIGPVDIRDVHRASTKDLFDEWVPKLDDPSFFESSHHQAFVTLTLCRILHRASSDDIVSKRVAAAWVRETYPLPWVVDLVERAERWQHGDEMRAEDHVREFIRFVRNQVTP